MRSMSVDFTRKDARPLILRSAAPAILSAMLWACAALRASDEAPTVDIPDPTLAHVIRLALNKPVGAITVADMEHLEAIESDRYAIGRSETWPSITNLAGLQAAKNLRTLTLRGGPVWGSCKCVYAGGPITPTTPIPPDPDGRCWPRATYRPWMAWLNSKASTLGLTA